MELEKETLEYALRKALEGMALTLSRNPRDLSGLTHLDEALGMLEDMPFEINLWTIQNVCYELLETAYPALKAKADQGEEEAGEWVDRFSHMAETLSVKVPDSGSESRSS